MRDAAETATLAVKKSKEHGVAVSYDLNFRKNLWKWAEPEKKAVQVAREVTKEILPYVDVLIGNEEDALACLGINAGNSDAEMGRLEIASYPEVARKIASMFPNIKFVATTLRESVSADSNKWGAVLYEARSDKSHFAPIEGEKYSPYAITDIVDRVGGGDSFAAGLIYGLSTEPYASEPGCALSFAVAASCLCHSIKGDVNFSSLQEIEALMAGDKTGRVKR